MSFCENKVDQIPPFIQKHTYLLKIFATTFIVSCKINWRKEGVEQMPLCLMSMFINQLQRQHNVIWIIMETVFVRLTNEKMITWLSFD